MKKFYCLFPSVALNKRGGMYVLITFLVLLSTYYFINNPYKTSKFSCEDTNKLNASLTIDQYLVHNNELTFKNIIFNKDECKNNNNIIECVITDSRRDNEKVIFDLQNNLLIHHWLSYDSGQFIYDKTQTRKTKREDRYQCDPVSILK